MCEGAARPQPGEAIFEVVCIAQANHDRRSNRLPTPGRNPVSLSIAAISRSVFVFNKRSISAMTAGFVFRN